MALFFTVFYFWVTIITLIPFSSQAQHPPPIKVNLSDPDIYNEMFKEINNRVLVDKNVKPFNLALIQIIEMWNLVTTIYILQLI